MSKVQVQTQAKTPAAPAPASQPPVAVPERAEERPDIATQLEGAARLGHSLEAFSVDGSGPPILQRQELPEEEEEEELPLQREPAVVQRQEIPEEEEEELQMKREPATLQRQEIPEEEEEELLMQREPGAVQRQEPPEEEAELQMKPDLSRVGLEGGPVPPDVEAAIGRARGGGQPLDGTTQAQMGETLGHDFSGVRVHTDAEADALNQQLSARAFTTGRDIFFGQGEYNPGSGSSRELLAHELSHVVQQSSGRVSGDGSGMTVRPAGDAFEQEAEALGRRADRTSRTNSQMRVEASNAMADQGREETFQTRQLMETGGKDTRPNPLELSGTQPMPTMRTGCLVQRFPLAVNPDFADPRVLSGMMCNQSVGTVLMNAGKITQQQYKAHFSATEDAGKWVDIANEGTPPEYENIPEDAVIGIKKGLDEGRLRWSHFMLSIGGGLALGSNNACVFKGGSAKWEGFKLKEAQSDREMIRMYWRTAKSE